MTEAEMTTKELISKRSYEVQFAPNEMYRHLKENHHINRQPSPYADQVVYWMAGLLAVLVVAACLG